MCVGHEAPKQHLLFLVLAIKDPFMHPLSPSTCILGIYQTCSSAVNAESTDLITMGPTI